MDRRVLSLSIFLCFSNVSHSLLFQVPERARGYLFEYELVPARRGEGATVRYTDRIYKPGADTFEVFKESDEVQYMPYPVDAIADTHKQWLKALGHTNAVIYEERERLRREASGAMNAPIEVSDDTTFDLSDIDQLFEKEGKGPHMLKMDFVAETEEPIEYVEKSGRPSKYWWWAHRLTNTRVKLFATVSGKQFDTGRLSKALMRIRKREHPLAYARAKRILTLNRAYIHSQQATE